MLKLIFCNQVVSSISLKTYNHITATEEFQDTDRIWCMYK